MSFKNCAWNVFGVCAAVAVLHVAAGAAVAQGEEKPAVTLKAGDAAPPLAVESWIKGEPVARFEKGKVYVLEFWATWCGPCIASMPELSALQKAYKDKAVTIIGTNVRETKEYTDETLKKVQDFVKEQAERMSYTVAYDGKAKVMDSAYMTAAGRNGIPCAFLIDKAGKIAWIGHPMWLEIPLQAVVEDKWDLQTGPDLVAKGQEQLNKVYEKMQLEPKDAVAAWEVFEREYPKMAERMSDMKFNILLAAAQFEQAYKLAVKLVDEAVAAKDSNQLNAIAWAIVDPAANVEKKDLDLALKAAQKADELNKHENAAVLDTLARVWFLKSEIDKAIELEAKAVELAKGAMKEQLQEVLDQYKSARK